MTIYLRSTSGFVVPGPTGLVKNPSVWLREGSMFKNFQQEVVVGLDVATPDGPEVLVNIGPDQIG